MFAIGFMGVVLRGVGGAGVGGAVSPRHLESTPHTQPGWIAQLSALIEHLSLGGGHRRQAEASPLFELLSPYSRCLENAGPALFRAGTGVLAPADLHIDPVRCRLLALIAADTDSQSALLLSKLRLKYVHDEAPSGILRFGRCFGPSHKSST